MADYLSTYVVDTSILIDMHIGKTIPQLFTLPYIFVAPDVIIAELHEPDSASLLKLGLQQKDLTGEQVKEVIRLRKQYRKPSVNDLFALVLARILAAPLLTNDGSLRKAAIQEKIPVHGTLWILDEMVERKIISHHEAAAALKRMCKQGSSLPQDECDKRLAQWLM